MTAADRTIAAVPTAGPVPVPVAAGGSGGSGEQDVRVVRGAPDAEQLAAVTVVLLAILRGVEPDVSPPPPPAGWARGAHRLPGAWTAN